MYWDNGSGILVFQASIMSLTPASVALSACWKARGSFWRDSVARKWTRRPYQCWRLPVQVVFSRSVLYSISWNIHCSVFYCGSNPVFISCISFRVDLLCGEDSWWIHHPVHQHNAIAPADNGFSSQGLFCLSEGTKQWTSDQRGWNCPQCIVPNAKSHFKNLFFLKYFLDLDFNVEGHFRHRSYCIMPG